MKKLLVVFFTLCSLKVLAQKSEIFHVGYTITSPRGNHGETVQSASLSLRIPFLMSPNFTAGGGIAYESMQSKYFSPWGTHSVHGLGLQSFFQYKLNERTAVSAAATTGLYSDFADITAEDFRFAAMLRYSVKLRDSIPITVGLGYSHQFFGIFLAPYFDFEWDVSKRVQLKGPFPLNLRGIYKVSQNTDLIIFLKPDNGTYRLSSQYEQSRYLQKKQWHLGLGIEHALSKHWIVTMRASATPKMKIEVYESSSDGRVSIFTFDVGGARADPISSYTAKAMSLDIGISWRLY